MRVEVKPEHVQFDEEEHGENYIRDRVKSLALVKNLSYLTILLLIGQIVLDIIHLTIHGLPLTISLLSSASVFLLSVGLIIYWAGEATKNYKANTELFQPRVSDRLTKTIYIGALIFAATAVVLLVNLLVQREYSPDFVTAHSAVQATWDDNYGGRTVDGINKFLRVINWIQVGFNAYYIIYFLLVARTAFKCLKFDNQAMSYLVFLGNALLLAFGLGLIYLADHALGYSDYPQIRAHFPFWNIKGLYFAGVCVAVVSLLGFLVDHRSWRVGFLVLSLLLLICIVLLGNFSGFAYRHIGETYKYYKGTDDVQTCLNRIQFVNLRDLEDIGCPQKYLPANAECDNPRVTPWEPLETETVDATRAEDQSSARTAAAPTNTATDAPANTATDAPAGQNTTTTPDDRTNPATVNNPDASTDTTTNTTTNQGDQNTTTVNNPDGSTTTDTTTPNQNTTTVNNPDGSTTTNTSTPTDQGIQNTTTTTNPDGTTTTTTETPNADGNQTTTTTTNPDGTTTTNTDNANDQGTGTTTTTTNGTTGDTTTATTPPFLTSWDIDLSPRRYLEDRADDGTYCYNLKCCGLLGQLYTDDLLRLANMALLAMLAAVLISVACYYFWFVKWVDAARDKRKDYIWLVIMIALIVGFVVAMAAWNLPYVSERLDSNNRHMESFSW